MKIDHLLSKKFNEILEKNRFLKNLSLFLSNYLIFLMFILVFVVLYFSRQSQFFLISFKIGLNLLLVWVLVIILRRLKPRLRPFLVLKINKLSDFLIGPEGSSFPSLHAAVAFSCGFSVLPEFLFFGIIILILASLVSLGRILIGVHYLTDILGGIFLAAGVFLLTRLFIF